MSSADATDQVDEGAISDSPAGQDVVADSSPAEGVENTYLEAINRVFDKEGAEASPAPGDGEGKPSPEPNKDAKPSQDGDPSEDELRRYPPNSQKRIRQLLSQRDDIKERFEAETSAL